MSSSKVRLYRNKIVIYYKKGDSFLRYDTGIRVNNKADFSKTNEGLKDRVKNSSELNKRIRNLRNKIDSIIQRQVDNPSIKINLKYIKDELLKGEKHRGDLILPYYDDFYDRKEKDIIADKMSLSSLKDYISLKNALLDFQDSIGGEITLQNINKDLVSDFSTFLQKTRQPGSRTKGGLGTNTLIKRLILLYSFFRYVEKITEYKFPEDTYENKLKKEEVYIEVLEKDEVLSLRDLKLTDEVEKKVRDIFIFTCMTGLRWSDLQTLNKTQVYQSSGCYYIRKKNEKTDVVIYVPLNKTSLTILKRYNYNLKYLTNQQFNNILKKIIRETGKFNKTIDKVDKETGKKNKRWKVISIHKGRHTFVSNLVKSRVPVNEIMKYTGHTKLETLMEYINKRTPITDTFVNELEEVE